jgi:integrase
MVLGRYASGKAGHKHYFVRSRSAQSRYNFALPYLWQGTIPYLKGNEMGDGKQAGIITPTMERALLNEIENGPSRYKNRGRVLFLLSIKAGLRACEIAALDWSMVLTGDGEIASHISLPNKASKGSYGGRRVPIHSQLKAALQDLAREETRDPKPGKRQSRKRDITLPNQPVIQGERGGRISNVGVARFFYRLYKRLGYDQCSSHSGRRTYITRAARNLSLAGATVRDLQQLAGHASLQHTMRYIEGDSEAKEKLTEMI